MTKFDGWQTVADVRRWHDVFPVRMYALRLHEPHHARSGVLLPGLYYAGQGAGAVHISQAYMVPDAHDRHITFPGQWVPVNVDAEGHVTLVS